MKILCTGHLGFIGSRLFRVIKEKGFDVVGIDLKDGQNLITCDLPKKIDIIYHLAAQSSVEASWHDPVHDADNLRMTARLVKEYPDAKIIYVASSAHHDTSPYGFSKWASSEYIQSFQENYIICVLPNVYGEKGGRSVVDIFKNSNEVTVYGDGEQTRSYVHVDDIVEALVLAKDWDNGEYSLGNNESTTVLDLAEGKKINFAPARKESRDSYLENDTPNWEPKIKVKDYLHGKI